MPIRSKLKNIVRKLDMRSPYPIFYPFIMSSDEKNIFDAAVKKSRHYIEFGLGGSTLRAIQKSNAKIYAVESSSEWLAQMRRYFIFRYFENKRLHIFSVNIGPTKDWGYPEQDNDKNLFEAYPSKIFESIDRKIIDLALVDGRFRVACTLKIILACYENKNIKIIIHDFWNREQYHMVLKYLSVVERADTLGVFEIKNDIDIESVKNDFEAYKFNPE